jgi:RHS repeat-associated protein
VDRDLDDCSPTLGALVYNAREQTTSIGGTSATYAGASQVERLTFGADSFLNDALGVGRRSNGGTNTDLTRDPAGIELAENVAGSRYYFAFDGLGSVVGLFDTSGNLVSNYVARYEPFGKLIDSLPVGYPSLPLRFAGYWFDAASGLYKVGLRYYDANDSRWTQRDPIDDPLALRGWNRYDYAGDDPVNIIDPEGLSPWWKRALKVGLGVGSIALGVFTTGEAIAHAGACLAAAAATTEAVVGVVLPPLCIGIGIEGATLGFGEVLGGAYLIDQGLHPRRRRR